MDDINRHCKMFIYERLLGFQLIWNRPFDTPISFCVYRLVKISITLTPNKAEESFMRSTSSASQIIV